MRRFQFKLDPLLQMRKRKEEQARLDLARKNRQILDARNQLGGIHTMLSDFQAQEKNQRAHASNIMQLRYSVAYRHKLKQQLLSKGREIDRMRGDFRNLRVSLQMASKDKKAVELLRDRRYEEWRKNAGAEEQAITDEISRQGYIRNQKNAENPDEQ
ncbi:MAG: flagellar export protein FliJ [Chitinivibrionales bacterium]|nr:flagellar export protein FliJ [Chitinivibrionales bacterium]